VFSSISLLKRGGREEGMERGREDGVVCEGHGSSMFITDANEWKVKRREGGKKG